MSFVFHHLGVLVFQKSLRGKKKTSLNSGKSLNNFFLIGNYFFTL